MILDHVALVVENPKKSAAWYCENFEAKLIYADESWSIIQLDNIKLAFVISKQHPAHIAFRVDSFGDDRRPKSHRDGTESYYTRDQDGNIIEMIK